MSHLTRLALSVHYNVYNTNMFTKRFGSVVWIMLWICGAFDPTTTEQQEGCRYVLQLDFRVFNRSFQQIT
jgi:hypothetical protein